MPKSVLSLVFAIYSLTCCSVYAFFPAVGKTLIAVAIVGGIVSWVVGQGSTREPYGLFHENFDEKAESGAEWLNMGFWSVRSMASKTSTWHPSL